MNTFEALTPGSVAIILLGVAFLGGAIGSFLNVVIYRLPAGLSLIHPPSRCPKCEHPIRAYDNIPVLGWILLRGKCRDCGEPISARYPIIEAIVMLTFLLVAWLEWFGVEYGFGLLGFTLSLESLVARAGLHVLLLTTLLGVGMVEWDRERVPRLMWLPVILASIATWVFLPSLTIVHAWAYKPTIMSGLIDGLVGAAAGAAVGGILWLIEVSLLPKHRTSLPAKQEKHTLVLSTLCVGLIFGWQVVVLIGLMYLPFLCTRVHLQKTTAIKRLLPHGLSLFVLALASIVLFSLIPF